MSTDAAINSVVDAKQAAVQSQIGFAVAAKAQSAYKSQGDAAVQLIEAAGQITQSLGKAHGKGHHFDAVR
ncbi:MAG: hypothetical protein KDA37_01580 [Planctomycetales bacterium]|nr:hypothetical protein [Planctomycetales bacterium]